MLRSEEIDVRAEREFGLIKAVELKLSNTTVVTVEHYRNGYSPLFHRTRWPVNLLPLKGLPYTDFIIRNFKDRYPGQQKTPTVLYKKDPFAGYYYLVLSSELNLADFVSEKIILTHSLDLPERALRRKLRSIYRNYPKP